MKALIIGMTGPLQSPIFVLSNFVKQIALIKTEKKIPLKQTLEDLLAHWHTAVEEKQCPQM